MDTLAVGALGLALIWVGYDFIAQKDLMTRWAMLRNDGKPQPRTPASDRRSNAVGGVLMIGGLALVVGAIIASF